MKKFLLSALFYFAVMTVAFSQTISGYEMDEVNSGKDKVEFYFFGHASLMIRYNGQHIYIDPVSQYAKYDQLPKADLILITHDHSDHLDLRAIKAIINDSTDIVSNNISALKNLNSKILGNNQSIVLNSINIEAVPAYNTTKGRIQYHPKGRDNGYVLTLGKTRIYIAGDTEDIEEMKKLKGIDIAFLPVNQPYTMKTEQLLNAVKMINPKIVYPYHFSYTNKIEMQEIIENNTKSEVRIRKME